MPKCIDEMRSEMEVRLLRFRMRLKFGTGRIRLSKRVEGRSERDEESTTLSRVLGGRITSASAEKEEKSEIRRACVFAPSSMVKRVRAPDVPRNVVLLSTSSDKVQLDA